MRFARSLMLLLLLISILGATGQKAASPHLTRVQQGGHTPIGWLSLNWSIIGRAGSHGGDWEFGIGRNNFAVPAQTAQWEWRNSQTVPWSLHWSGATAKFQVGAHAISFAQSPAPSQVMTSFYLLIREETARGPVAPGTTLEFQVNQVNGMAVTPVLSRGVASAQKQQLIKQFWTCQIPIVSLAGVIRMTWPSNSINPQVGDARSRLLFKLEGFDHRAWEVFLLFLNKLLLPRNVFSFIRERKQRSTDGWTPDIPENR